MIQLKLTSIGMPSIRPKGMVLSFNLDLLDRQLTVFAPTQNFTLAKR
ncbi:MAG: hypothetical protein CM1200mP27_02950 [Chloroflexota bacterium]|nr:MAG: hypothetical protein CM1200mP27_02950 [Chloroflexota bacterium]